MADRGHRDAICPRIAYMPQGLGKNLYKELSVFENIDFFARLFGQGAEERKARIDVLLEATGLGPFPDRLAGRLSGGMKQRVALARTLANEPEVLLCDEPFAALDAMTRQVLQQELSRIVQHEERTCVFITHSIDETSYLARTSSGSLSMRTNIVGTTWLCVAWYLSRHCR